VVDVLLDFGKPLFGLKKKLVAYILLCDEPGAF
jgi:hypothetical protein